MTRRRSLDVSVPLKLLVLITVCLIFLLQSMYSIWLYTHYFRQIFWMNSFTFPCSFVGRFVLQGCVADEKAVDCAEIDEMLLTVISNTVSKIFNTIVTGILFNLFSYFGVPVPSWKYKLLVFKLIENSADIVVELLEYRNISHKLASWCVHIDDVNNMFRVWNDFAFDSNFWNRKALVWYPI